MWDSFLQSLSLATLDQFHFLRPWLGLLFFPFLLPLWFLYRNKHVNKQWHDIIAPHILQALLLRRTGKQRFFDPLVLFFCIVSCSILITMGPTWVQQPSPFQKDETGLVILLDVSSSMNSRDVQPDRITRARQKIRDLLSLRQGSKTALIVYAGSAHTVLPFTDDVEILTTYLESVSPDIMPRVGKFPEKALPLVDSQLASLPVPGTLLVVADGLGSASEAAFADYFSTHPHQLLVLGVGSENPSASGQQRYPSLDVRSLKGLAEAANGHYIALTVDSDDVVKINRRAGNYFVTQQDKNVPWQDFGYYLLFVMLLLFLPWFRKGVHLRWGLALFIAIGLSLPDAAYAEEDQPRWQQTIIGWWLTPDQQGRWYFDRGEYKKAAARFEDPMWKGMSFYMAENFLLAAEYFSRIDSEQARFNRANALAHAEHYVTAVRLFQSILDDNPTHAAAEKNRARLQAIIDEINQTSAAQADEFGTISESRELSDDEPLRAEGAERQTMAVEELTQYSAEEVWQDQSINEMWMRAVQQNPADFLETKFSIQLSREAP